MGTKSIKITKDINYHGRWVNRYDVPSLFEHLEKHYMWQQTPKKPS